MVLLYDLGLENMSEANISVGTYNKVSNKNHIRKKNITGLCSQPLDITTKGNSTLNNTKTSTDKSW